ncbi:MAG: sigma 54-interacting transcriptional regulator [Gemmatimonadota bacterium]
MNGTVLISTHRLEVAGNLRKAFQSQGYGTDLVPAPEHLARDGESPVALVLTGEREADGQAWAGAADQLGFSLVTVLNGDGWDARGKELGAVERFGGGADADEVAFTVHRSIQRRRLQESIGIIGESEPMREVLARIIQIAPVESTVLITGESGTGKELVARGIHQLSPRRHRGFLAVNVAALSESLLESELFGHEKGAFTGAIDARRGFFEIAHRGTLFLDEIGEMPLSTQTKLLRVLEQREFMRVGGEKPIRVDVRIICATNRRLRDQVLSGDFRRDLYYRLNILNVTLPPLRDRREDVPVLIDHFVRDLVSRMDRSFSGISPEAMELLKAYDWPGNVRELRNLVESMVVLSPGREVGPRDIPEELRTGRRSALLPVPFQPHAIESEADAGSRGDGPSSDRSPAEGPGGLRPEMEFVFRTLMDMRVDMDELRREFEAYREEVEDRLDGEEGSGWLLSPAGGVEVGVRTAPRLVGRGDADAEEGGAESTRSVTTEGSTPDRVNDEARGEDRTGRVVFEPGMTMDELEERAIRSMLRETDGNRRLAAEALGIGERTLYRKIKTYGIDV